MSELHHPYWVISPVTSKKSCLSWCVNSFKLYKLSGLADTLWSNIESQLISVLEVCRNAGFRTQNAEHSSSQIFCIFSFWVPPLFSALWYLLNWSDAVARECPWHTLLTGLAHSYFGVWVCLPLLILPFCLDVCSLIEIMNPGSHFVGRHFVGHIL